MLSRRDVVTAGIATAAILGGGFGRRLAAQALNQDELLRFDALGQVTLLHIADCHAQLLPIHFREPSINLGVGESAGLPPHLVGLDLLRKFSIAPGGAEAFALTHEDFATLAHHYGRLGGMDRLATLINAIRAERPGRVLMLDGGDTWQGSYTALHNQGADMVEVQKALGVDAMTAHWEFTYGDERVKELASSLGFPFLAGNVKDTTWSEDVFDGTARFERGGVKVAVIGQAFPYTPIANPRYMMADWSFGIEEERLAKRVTAARDDGADLVVLLSHNGFDVDRKLVGRVPGIDVILTGHTHDALPAGIEVGRTLLVASGSHGKFLSRLDLDVRDRRVAAYRYRLIPVFAEAIQPDPTMAALVARIRAPHDAMLGRELGRTESLLYRRGNFNGSFDDLICQAMLAERDAEIALSPGFRWGNSLLPGEPITVEDVYNLTAITYPACYRTTMSGAFLKEILEDVADNLFHPDPYYQQGGDMVRVGGLAYTIDPKQKIGRRISDLTHIKSGQPVEATRDYVVTGWASVNQGTEGPPIWDVVMRHVERVKSVTIPENRHVRVVGL